MPSIKASITSRPVAPICSAKGRSAEATGPAGWMMVLRWVSSKSKVCEVMPLIKAALAMSTRSLRPAMLACGAGCNILTAAKAARAAAWSLAPIAQPNQFKKVRCASWSTASDQPLDGWVATNSAKMWVTAGALWSATTVVLVAMKKESEVVNKVKRKGNGIWRKRRWTN